MMETDRLRLLRVEPSEPSMDGRPTTLLNVRDAGGGKRTWWTWHAHPSLATTAPPLGAP